MPTMAVEIENATLVDKYISHSHNGAMMDTYLSFSYEKRKEVFEKLGDYKK